MLASLKHALSPPSPGSGTHCSLRGILSHPLPYHTVLQTGVLTDPSKLPFYICHKDYWMLSLSHIMKNDVGMNNISHLLSAYHVLGTVLSTLHIMFCFVTTPWGSVSVSLHRAVKGGMESLRNSPKATPEQVAEVGFESCQLGSTKCMFSPSTLITLVKEDISYCHFLLVTAWTAVNVLKKQKSLIWKDKSLIFGRITNLMSQELRVKGQHPAM